MRSLRRSPGFTAVAVSTAAIGIGGTVAVFALVNAWLLRPLPYVDADRLVHLRGQEAANYAVVRTDFRILSERSRTIEEAAVLRPWSVTLRQPGGTLTRRSAASVSWNYFRLLGIRPVAGRFFLPGEGVTGAPVVVLSHAAWQRELGGRAAAIGGPLTVDGRRDQLDGGAPRSRG